MNPYRIVHEKIRLGAVTYETREFKSYLSALWAMFKLSFYIGPYDRAVLERRREEESPSRGSSEG